MADVPERGSEVNLSAAAAKRKQAAASALRADSVMEYNAAQPLQQKRFASKESLVYQEYL
jgi:hypothetical protein